LTRLIDVAVVLGAAVVRLVVVVVDSALTVVGIAIGRLGRWVPAIGAVPPAVVVVVDVDDGTDPRCPAASAP
jgi:hypothetical protein